jgi:Phage tail tube protein, GTA-gp10
MSRTAKVTAELGGEQYDFCIRIGELTELQEKLDVGPGMVLMRLIANQWRVEDIPTVIRLGLVGGGLEPAAASRLVRIHVEQRTFDWGGEDGLGILAVKILAAALNGAPDEPPGKAGETRNGSTISPTARSDSEASSAPLS